jgi:alanine dehydrogenase
MPGAVGRTSTFALCNVSLPYLRHIARVGLQKASRENPHLVSAVNVHDGHITHQAVADTFQLPCKPFV